MGIQRIKQGREIVDLQNERKCGEHLKDEHLPRIDAFLAADQVPQQPTKSPHNPRHNVDLHVVLVVELIAAQIVKVAQEEHETGQGD